MRLFCLSPDDVRNNWPDFQPLLTRFERCCLNLTAEQIRSAAIEERMQIWGLGDTDSIHGLCVTEIRSTAGGLVCQVNAAIGTASIPLMQRLMDEIGKWAQGLGCVAVELQGRKGWLRRLPQFHQTGITAEWTLNSVH